MRRSHGHGFASIACARRPDCSCKATHAMIERLQFVTHGSPSFCSCSCPRWLLHLPGQAGAAWVEPPDPPLWQHSPRTPVAELCLLCVLRVIAAARPRANGGSWSKENDLHAELTNLLHLLPRRRVELQLVHRNCLAGASVPEGKTQLCVRHELRSKDSELF